MGLDQILHHCILDHECKGILWECHAGIVGHVGGKSISWKVLQVCLGWLTLFQDAKVYAKNCGVCQRVGKSSCCEEILLHQVRALATFEKWFVDFIGPIHPPTCHSHDRYIIATTYYLTGWVEAVPVKDCIADMNAQFIFANITTRFGCPRILTSDQRPHFINEIVQEFRDTTS